MRIKFMSAGLAAGLAIACSPGPEAVSGPDPGLDQGVGGPASVGFVTGSAAILRATGWTTYEFHARLMPDGSAHGTFQIRRHLGTLGGAKIHGRIECVVVEGNQAWLGGIIERAEGPANVGLAFGFRVVDNGEGAGAPPDQIGRQWAPASAEAYCAERPESPLVPLEAGDFQVHLD